MDSNNSTEQPSIDLAEPQATPMTASSASQPDVTNATSDLSSPSLPHKRPSKLLLAVLAILGLFLVAGLIYFAVAKGDDDTNTNSKAKDSGSTATTTEKEKKSLNNLNLPASGKEFSTACYVFTAPSSELKNVNDFGDEWYARDYTVTSNEAVDSCKLSIEPSPSKGSNLSSIYVEPGLDTGDIKTITEMIKGRLVANDFGIEVPQYFTTAKSYEAARIRYKSGSDNVKSIYIIMDSNKRHSVQGKSVTYYTVSGYTGGDYATTPGRAEAMQQVANGLSIKP